MGGGLKYNLSLPLSLPLCIEGKELEMVIWALLYLEKGEGPNDILNPIIHGQPLKVHCVKRLWGEPQKNPREMTKEPQSLVACQSPNIFPILLRERVNWGGRLKHFVSRICWEISAFTKYKMCERTLLITEGCKYVV